MSSNSFRAAAQRATVLEKTPDGAFPMALPSKQRVSDAPALVSDAPLVGDPVSTAAGLKEATGSAHQHEARTVLTVFGWLFVSITMITISIILTAVYL